MWNVFRGSGTFATSCKRDQVGFVLGIVQFSLVACLVSGL